MFSGLTLTLNNKLVCYSIGGTASPLPNFTQLSTNACVGLRYHGLFLIKYFMFLAVSFVQLYFTVSSA